MVVVDCRHCWLVVVPSVLVWMGVVVANGPVVASMVFSIVLGYLGSDEDCFPFACYEDVFFLEYIDPSFCEDRNCAII
jgi:hypothetical protein